MVDFSLTNLVVLSGSLQIRFLGQIIFGGFLGQIVTRTVFIYNLAGCHRAAFATADLVSKLKGES